MLPNFNEQIIKSVISWKSRKSEKGIRKYNIILNGNKRVVK